MENTTQAVVKLKDSIMSGSIISVLDVFENTEIKITRDTVDEVFLKIKGDKNVSQVEQQILAHAAQIEAELISISLPCGLFQSFVRELSFKDIEEIQDNYNVLILKNKLLTSHLEKPKIKLTSIDNNSFQDYAEKFWSEDDKALWYWEHIMGMRESQRDINEDLEHCYQYFLRYGQKFSRRERIWPVETKSDEGSHELDFQSMTIKERELLMRTFKLQRREDGVWSDDGGVLSANPVLLSKFLELLYQQEKVTKRNVLLNKYIVDFNFMVQINKKTGFIRKLKREPLKNDNAYVENISKDLVELVSEASLTEKSHYNIYGTKPNCLKCYIDLQGRINHALKQYAFYLKHPLVNTLMELETSVESLNAENCVIAPHQLQISCLESMEAEIEKIIHKYEEKEIKSLYSRYWVHESTPFDRSIHYQFYQIATDSEEFSMVQRRLLETLPNATLLYVERIQNPYLAERYVLTKLLMRETRGEENLNTELLFHGTSCTDPEKIYGNIDAGFDLQFAKERGLYGNGIYFHKDANYSGPNYANTSTAKDSGGRVMLLAEVVLGRICKFTCPQSVIKAPDGYDSVTDSSERMRIIYSPHRAYPLYLIEYK